MHRTTNKPNELDDALVRAGRISVRVGFSNASKRQAEEIFLRMFIDLSTSSSLRGIEESIAPAPASGSDSEKQPCLNLPDDEKTAHVRTLAKSFAAQVREGDFSPADLQDYLLIHKKDPEKAVGEVQGWMEKVYEERKKKDEEQQGQKEARREEKKRERERFREEVKAAVKGLSGEEDSEREIKGGEKEKGEKEGDGQKAHKTETDKTEASREG
jgi:mitochondrial chaperone BCS1